MDKNTVVRMTVIFPKGKERCVDINITDELGKYLEPLPAEREIYEEVQGFHPIAEEMKRNRVDIAKHLGKTFGDAFIKIIESRDPVNGYPTEEQE